MGSSRIIIAVGITFLAASSVAAEQRPERQPAPAPEEPASEPPSHSEHDPQSSGVDDICKTDPAACPKLDLAAEASRNVEPEGYATLQSLGSYDPSLPGKASDSIIMPRKNAELGGEMAFITAQSLPSDGALADTASDEARFTDIALFRARARGSFSDTFELYGGTELLAKQPTTLDEPIWQSKTLASNASAPRLRRCVRRGVRVYTR